MRTCFRCRHPFRPEDGYGGVFLSRGRTELDQLHNGRSLHVCDECAETLQAWLGIPPSIPAAPPPPELHPRPFSAC